MSRQSLPKLRFEPNCLNRVILGWKMSESDKLQIRQWAKQRSPELKVSIAYYDSFEQALAFR